MEKEPYSSQSFKKAERLTGTDEINRLFMQGKSFLVFPFRVSYRTSESAQPYPVKVLIGVKKKTHKRAVKRNLIKRRGKEAYRLHKAELYNALEKNGLSIHLGLIYISPDILDYHTIEKAMIKVIATLKKNLAI